MEARKDIDTTQGDTVEWAEKELRWELGDGAGASEEWSERRPCISLFISRLSLCSV